MISLAQNRSIFNVTNAMLDRAREMGSPLSWLNTMLMTNGANNPQQDVIKSNIAENEAKATRADELIAAWAQITKNEKVINDYMSGLERIMFVTQHKLRKPVTNMIGMTALLDNPDASTEEIQQVAKYMQKSAMDLDIYTRELTGMLCELSQKGKK